MRASAPCPQGRRCPGMSPPDASGSSKANKCFPAGVPAEYSSRSALQRHRHSQVRGLPKHPPQSFPCSPRFGGTQAIPGATPRLSLPSGAAPPPLPWQRHPQRLRIFAPFSAAPYRPRRRTLRLIPRLAVSPAFAFPRSPATSPFSRSRPPLRIASQAFFLYIPSQGKSSLSIFS